MNKLYIPIISLVCLLALWGCQEEIIEPKSCFSMDVTEANVGESVTFTNCGTGMAFSIWTGDTYHNYSKYGTDAGVAFDDEFFSYAYPEPGTFTVVLVATSYGNNPSSRNGG